MVVFGESGKSIFPAFLSQPGFVEGVRFRLWVEGSRGDFEGVGIEVGPKRIPEWMSACSCGSL